MSHLKKKSNEAELSRRSRLSRGRGRNFENHVVKRLTSLGYKAKKKLLSGSYLKKPYDVIVSPCRLKIEAKRTLKEHITIQDKWLRRIGPKLIVVFAVGRYSGKRQVEMFALSLPSLKDPLAKMGVKIRKSRKIEGEDIKKAQYFVLYGEDHRTYFGQPLERYMKINYPLEEKNDSAGEQPVHTEPVSTT